jgi:hypothetical protein
MPIKIGGKFLCAARQHQKGKKNLNIMANCFFKTKYNTLAPLEFYI